MCNGVFANQTCRQSIVLFRVFVRHQTQIGVIKRHLRRINFADAGRGSTKHLQFQDLTLQLGSIHSVKGKSVDGILVVESEVWKGSRAGQQCIDLSTVLPTAFGVTNERFTGVELAAATNIFVGVTRARELLGLAMRKSEAAKLIGPALEQGWKVVDLVAQAE
ncbi:hypothetical protein [Pseudomonas rhodesiae]|jgi:DNA helicase-2/ATP-dependent DNA helicase PcrA|uniref:hypothetical protein n=1 Tax=Pseudomonas rhodesiae TaxID=76760 RepID=UPI00209F039D|nr:hypothetical protein [Pseudomonas rhodesiae]MCP1515475.1 hypothetical protein [Pseudomonas rhodesiae]MDF9769213.1 hypothetical protein [Pseudomonas rhodesiae]